MTKCKPWFMKLCLIVFFLSSISIFPEVSAQSAPNLKVKSAVVVDSQVGQILADQDSDELVEVGALTKILGLYLILKAVEDGQYGLGDYVPISDQAYALSQDYDIHNVPLRQDFNYTVKELIQSIAINGANGSMLALAEFHSENEQSFVKAMENQLKAWNIDNYHLYNATGLADEFIPNDVSTIDQGQVNQMTAYACATATYQLLQLYPEFIEDTGRTKAIFKGDSNDPFDMTTTVEMLPGMAYEYEGVNGLIIGTSFSDGDSAIITSQRNDLSVITVLLGTGRQGDGSRYKQAKIILDYIYATYVSNPVILQGQEVTQMAQIKVDNGSQDYVDIDYGSSLTLATPIIDTAPRLTYHFVKKEEVFKGQETLKAPIKAGTEIGYMVVDVEGVESQFLDFSLGNTVPVVVRNRITELNWFDKMLKGVGETVDNTWESTRKFFTDIFN